MSGRVEKFVLKWFVHVELMDGGPWTRQEWLWKIGQCSVDKVGKWSMKRQLNEWHRTEVHKRDSVVNRGVRGIPGSLSCVLGCLWTFRSETIGFALYSEVAQWSYDTGGGVHLLHWRDMLWIWVVWIWDRAFL